MQCPPCNSIGTPCDGSRIMIPKFENSCLCVLSIGTSQHALLSQVIVPGMAHYTADVPLRAIKQASARANLSKHSPSLETAIPHIPITHDTKVLHKHKQNYPTWQTVTLSQLPQIAYLVRFLAVLDLYRYRHLPYFTQRHRRSPCSWQARLLSVSKNPSWWLVNL